MDPVEIGIYSIDKSSLKVDEINIPLYTPVLLVVSPLKTLHLVQWVAIRNAISNNFMQMLSIRWNDFIASKSTSEFSCMLLSQRSIFDSFYMDIQTHAEQTRNDFIIGCIHGNDWIAVWAYAEMLKSHRLLRF